MAEDFVSVTIVGNEAEAEIACAALRAEGIDAMHRQTNFAAGAMDGMRGGPQEILVRSGDADRARELLAASS